jgi:Ser/Thr protein kinase RdoA (MazF antagonist)
MTQDPDLAGSLLSLPPPDLSPETLGRLAKDHWGVEGWLTRLVSERDLNHRLDTDGASFTLKLANPAEPPGMTDFQTRALLHVAATDTGLPTPRVIPGRDGRHVIPLSEGALRLLSWCPGSPAAHVPLSPALAASIGATLARLTLALAGFDHPGADHVLLWDIRRFALLDPLIPALPAHLQHEAFTFRDRYTAAVAPALIGLPLQIVHSDFNLHNLLTDPEDPTRISGILDFGDMVRTYRVCDLAVSASYLMNPDDPLSLLVPLVTAYHARLPLLAEEIVLLPDLITARMLTSLTISNWRAHRYPGNADYILRNAASARAGLHAFSTTSPAQLAAALLSACERPTR